MAEKTHAEWLEGLSFRKLRQHLENHPDDEDAREIYAEQCHGEDFTDMPDDAPTVANCDDWGTGEGRYHGRM